MRLLKVLHRRLPHVFVNLYLRPQPKFTTIRNAHLHFENMSNYSTPNIQAVCEMLSGRVKETAVAVAKHNEAAEKASKKAKKSKKSKLQCVNETQPSK